MIVQGNTPTKYRDDKRIGAIKIKPEDLYNISETTRKALEMNQKITDIINPIITQQERINNVFSSILEQHSRIQGVIAQHNKVILSIANNPIAKQQEHIRDLIPSVLEQQSHIQEIVAQNDVAISAVINDPMADAIRLIDDKIAGIGSFAIESLEVCRGIGELVVRGIEETKHLATGFTNLMNSPVMAELRSTASMIGTWLQTVDFTPLISIFESIKDCGFEYDYDSVEEIYLKAMFDARWFPYAAHITDFMIVDEIFDILDTSRASKNRTKRIDKVIFTYYNKDELSNIKRGWRQLKLPPYMTRILIQSVQAYNRREYALTVSALSTLWEGIIQEKVNDGEYRVSQRTRDNLSKLIEENEFNKIFESFCDEFIFYNCKKPEDVKPDVPGRHAIAHCWYDTYPNRKVALNAILFTDFLLRLKPLDRQEERL